MTSLSGDEKVESTRPLCIMLTALQLAIWGIDGGRDFDFSNCSGQNEIWTISNEVCNSSSGRRRPPPYLSFENVLHGKCLLFENKTWCFVQSMVPQPANAIKSFKLRFLCCVQQVNLNHCAFQFNAFIQHITIVHSTRCINKMHCCAYLSWYCNKNSNQARDFLCQKDAMACKSSIIWDDNATFHEMQLGS